MSLLEEKNYKYVRNKDETHPLENLDQFEKCNIFSLRTSKKEMSESTV
jgi:hypothetical protein